LQRRKTIKDRVLNKVKSVKRTNRQPKEVEAPMNDMKIKPSFYDNLNINNPGGENL
jgi:hypothetical protein